MTSDTTATLVSADSAVRAVFGETSAAWAEGDADAFASRYSANATAILPGFYLPNKAAIRTNMAVAFAGPLKGSRRIHELQAVRFLGDGTAIVISRSVTTFDGDGEPGQWEWATWVLAEHDGRWLIEAYHGCPENAA
ncbi:MAG TPA: SgcJ/EcaC family oxidoreductase [Jatrophihabitantaceae bacterium]